MGNFLRFRAIHRAWFSPMPAGCDFRSPKGKSRSVIYNIPHTVLVKGICEVGFLWCSARG